ncbi:hypothetical protein Fot_56705 [Forsythia ovata]|uniref:Uncharacterized protein n=1 Tax=Forsythia ovata TaxID=205694 RepID=A0ABD1NYY4_9LAMI
MGWNNYRDRRIYKHRFQICNDESISLVKVSHPLWHHNISVRQQTADWGSLPSLGVLTRTSHGPLYSSPSVQRRGPTAISTNSRAYPHRTPNLPHLRIRVLVCQPT